MFNALVCLSVAGHGDGYAPDFITCFDALRKAWLNACWAICQQQEFRQRWESFCTWR